MKIDVLLFTQTMQSLLESALPLQDALLVCSEILTAKNEKAFCKKILKEINEGKKLTKALSDYSPLFSPLYISLINVGEESGMLPQVFNKLSEYLKDRKNLKQKIIQSLAYPVLVLITAVIVIIVLLLFVLPELESIFIAFTESTDEIIIRAESIRTSLTAVSIIAVIIILLSAFCFFIHKYNEKAGLYADAILLKIPGIGKIIRIMQIHDFAFAMKLFCGAHYPFVESLSLASEVLTNRKLKKAVNEAAERISEGERAGKSFEEEKVFPGYLTAWIKIAEQNGNTDVAFEQISDYFSTANDIFMEQITAFAEPFFTLVTGIIIIAVISCFILPVIRLLGTL